jgi:hypothetical protein
VPDRKRLGLEHPRDLLAKLDWELDQFNNLAHQDDNLSSYRAFNCAVTAWSICDWVWNAESEEVRAALRAASPTPDAKGSEVLAALLRSECRELAICQQLANGAKHFRRDRHNDPTVASQRLPGVSLYISRDGSDSRIVSNVGVFIQDRSITYSDIGLFSRARDYWQEFFNRFNLN